MITIFRYKMERFKYVTIYLVSYGESLSAVLDRRCRESELASPDSGLPLVRRAVRELKTKWRHTASALNGNSSKQLVE